MKIVVIDYGSGNLKSVINALSEITQSEILISDQPQDLQKASHIILPGVGAFKDCMKGLQDKKGLVEEIMHQVKSNKKPFLGICVGMQVMATCGYEKIDDGTAPEKVLGLNLIAGEVVKIKAQANLKIPQMGWNNLIIEKNHSILKDIKSKDHVYFANSYHFLCKNTKNIIAKVNYGHDLNALIADENIFGIQFHPEKSGIVGLKILGNFLKL